MVATKQIRNPQSKISYFRIPTSKFCPPTSDLCRQSSVLRPPTSVFCVPRRSSKSEDGSSDLCHLHFEFSPQPSALSPPTSVSSAPYPLSAPGRRSGLSGEFYRPRAPGFCRVPGPSRRGLQCKNTGHPDRSAPGLLRPANLKSAWRLPRLPRRAPPSERLSGRCGRRPLQH